MFYYKITTEENGLSVIVDAIEFYEKEIQDAKTTLNLKNKNLKDVSRDLGSWTEYYYGQFQDLEMIIKWLELQLERARSNHYRNYTNLKNRAYTDRQIEKLIDGEQDVYDFNLLVNQVALTRNKLSGIMKALEAMNYQLSNITKLITAGMEDARL